MALTRNQKIKRLKFLQKELYSRDDDPYLCRLYRRKYNESLWRDIPELEAKRVYHEGPFTAWFQVLGGMFFIKRYRAIHETIKELETKNQDMNEKSNKQITRAQAIKALKKENKRLNEKISKVNGQIKTDAPMATFTALQSSLNSLRRKVRDNKIKIQNIERGLPSNGPGHDYDYKIVTEKQVIL